MIGGKLDKEGGTVMERVRTEGLNRAVYPPRRHTSGSQPTGQQRIVVIEADPDMGDWLLEEFRQAGYGVAVATTGNEGIELIRSGQVDLVVADMEQADLSGLDLLRELQSLDRVPKVILTTSLPSERQLDQAIDLGANAVLQRPFRMELLLSILARSLGN